jgi:hypothetical protein
MCAAVIQNPATAMIATTTSPNSANGTRATASAMHSVPAIATPMPSLR